MTGLGPTPATARHHVVAPVPPNYHLQVMYNPTYRFAQSVLDCRDGRVWLPRPASLRV